MGEILCLVPSSRDSNVAFPVSFDGFLYCLSIHRRTDLPQPGSLSHKDTVHHLCVTDRHEHIYQNTVNTLSSHISTVLDALGCDSRCIPLSTRMALDKDVQDPPSGQLQHEDPVSSLTCFRVRCQQSLCSRCRDLRVLGGVSFSMT